MIPFLLINLMTSYHNQYDIVFQYGFGSVVLLIYLSVINYVFFGLYYHRLDYREKYEKNACEHEVIDAALEVIPKDASVVSSIFLLPTSHSEKRFMRLKHQANNGILSP